MKRPPLPILLLAALALALALAACGDDDSSSNGGGEAGTSALDERTKPQVQVPSGAPPKQLQQRELIEGSGEVAESGDQVTVQYVGVNYKSGREFDASWDRGEPFAFQLGAGMVIPGWDQGVEGMKVGGRRELVIPPALAYGKAGAPPSIPPNETLVFVVDLVAVE